MFPNKAWGNRIHNMDWGIDLRQFEGTFWIKTGEKKKSMDLDDIVVVSLISETLRMLEFILIILCYCCISPMLPVLKYLKILICDLKERAVMKCLYMMWKIIVELFVVIIKTRSKTKGQDPGVFHVDLCSTINFKNLFYIRCCRN